MLRRLWQILRENPPKAALAMSTLIAIANLGLVIASLRAGRVIDALAAELEPMEADITELRKAEREGFTKLQAELDEAEARLVSLESSFPEIGAPFDIFRRGYELAVESDVEVASVHRGSTTVKETILGYLYTTRFRIEADADLEGCLGYISRLESAGLETLALEGINISPAEKNCSFDVVVASGTILETP